MSMSFKNISPVDGRYASKTSELKPFFSELAYTKYRLYIEIRYLIELISLKTVLPVEDSESIIQFLDKLYLNFSDDDMNKIKTIEKYINHDVKSIEYFIRNKLKEHNHPNINKFINFVHFGLTSQDINSPAISLMLKQSSHTILEKYMNTLLLSIKSLYTSWKTIPMLSRTHGQPASPTYLGKEMLVFYERLLNQIKRFSSITYSTKFGGAVGNFNAHYVSFPDIDWIQFGNAFIKKLGLKRNQYTTQIDHYDNYSELFDNLKRINVILIDFCRDVWLYISMNYFKLKIKSNEVGSSAMPHKVNPINFENAEGNLLYANSCLTFLSNELPLSRLQRDLCDSTLLRNVGTAFGHTLIGYKSLIEGIEKLDVNIDVIHADLNKNCIVISEAIQVKLKSLGIEDSYEKIKELTRIEHKDSSSIKDSIYTFIESINSLSDKDKHDIYSITPFNYTGKYTMI